MSDTINRKSRLTALILAVLFAFCAVSLSFSTILKNTLLDESYFITKVEQANISEQINVKLAGNYEGNISKLGLTSEDVEENIVAPISDTVIELVTVALYHSDQLAEAEENLETTLNDNIMSVINQWSPTAASMSQSIVARVADSVVDAVHSELKLYQLQQFGNTIALLRDVCNILFYVSIVLGILCMLYLLFAASAKYIVIPAIISGIVLEIAALITNFVPFVNVSDSYAVVSDFISQYQYNLASHLGFFALANAVAAVLLGVISIIIDKVKKH